MPKAPVSLDHERLLAHGRHRVRHRQAAARAGGRQHPRRRDADVPQPLGAHPQGHAQEGPRQGEDLDPLKLPDATADRPGGPLRPLREDLRALGAKRASRCRPASSWSATTPPPPSWSTTSSPASTGRTRTASTTLENGRLALFRNFDETRQPAPAPEHAADRQRATRSRRRARRQLPRHGRRRDRPLPPRDHRAHRRPPSRPRTSPTRNCSAKS